MADTQRTTTLGNRFTCVSCKLLFPSHSDQVEHYKGEFHRFNLKRKVAELPPVTLEVYEKKMQSTSLFYVSPIAGDFHPSFFF